ncbi:hypothetical protein RRG08_037530 [Elysia crispata]|uniref:Uncharacterized protein n=1 Tax=Elysia crispata TaxID=231223 RepID=A0AAE1A425_9GAST|nr:hypothetical protein RRG08_037530 [Elysia crispata]
MYWSNLTRRINQSSDTEKDIITPQERNKQNVDLRMHFMREARRYGDAQTKREKWIATVKVQAKPGQRDTSPGTNKTEIEVKPHVLPKAIEVLHETSRQQLNPSILHSSTITRPISIHAILYIIKLIR